MKVSYFVCLISAFSRFGVYGLDGPEQIHISLGNTTDVMVIMWATKTEASCHVNYGITPSKLNMAARSKTAKLNIDSWNALQHIHRAELSDLESGVLYFYKVSCENGSAMTGSSVYDFKTPAAETTRRAEFLVYGDMGAYGGIPTIPVLLKEVQTRRYDNIWHIGDFAYNLHSNGGQVGDEFLRNLEKVAARIPYMTSPGNHELEWDMHHYRMRFSMPNSDWPMPRDRLWYSVDLGPVHFISYSTEVFFVDNQDHVCQQYDWLLQDLIKANRNRHIRPWIVAMGHRPMYCSNKDIDDCTGRIMGYWVKYGLEDLFYAQGVDLVLEAHEHSYERLWPVYDFHVTAKNYHNPRAPVHVITGAAGCGENVDYMGTAKPWSAFRADELSRHSYGKLSVQNSTHLYFEQYSVDLNKTIDRFLLVQNNHGPNIPNITCGNWSGNHPTCQCPRPFHYITVGVVAGAILLVFIAICIYFCVKCCSCCGLCREKCARTLCCYRMSEQYKRLREYHARLKQPHCGLLLMEDSEEDLVM